MEIHNKSRNDSISSEMLIFCFGFIVQVWENWINLKRERRRKNER